MRILESERLLLKPVEPDDLAFLLDLRWDASIMEYLMHDPICLASQHTWLDACRKRGDLLLSVFLKKEGGPLLVGTVGLSEIDHLHQKAQWRWCRIDPSYQRRGIGYEATHMAFDYGFNTLNLHKITSDSFADNTAIINMSRKLGFVEEGVLRSHYFHKGAYRDAVIMGLFRDEFNRRKKEAMQQ